MDPESLYLQLGQLLSEMPQFEGEGPITPEMNRWLGRAVALVRQTGNIVDATQLSIVANNLHRFTRDAYAQSIAAPVYRALAAAEANAPSAARGGFVGVGAALDALQVVGKVLAEATKTLLIVDAYMDSKAFTDFAPSASSTVFIRLLTDGHFTKAAALLPGLTRWSQQFPGRPIEVRQSPPKVLHDRLIIADDSKVWTLTQSLKDFAGRSPALVQRIDPEIAERKVEFYSQLWLASTVVS